MFRSIRKQNCRYIYFSKILPDWGEISDLKILLRICKYALNFKYLLFKYFLNCLDLVAYD